MLVTTRTPSAVERPVYELIRLVVGLAGPLLVRAVELVVGHAVERPVYELVRLVVGLAGPL